MRVAAPGGVSLADEIDRATVGDEFIDQFDHFQVVGMCPINLKIIGSVEVDNEGNIPVAGPLNDVAFNGQRTDLLDLSD